MLDKIREKKSGLLTWIFVSIITVSFIAFFGPGSLRKTKKGCGVEAFAATVNGTPVSLEDFNFAYQSRKREMASRTGGKFNRDMEKALNLKQTVLDELIDLQILAQTAAKYGLVVTDEELNKSIMGNQSFQNSGKFDLQLYKRVVMYHFQITPKKFEERQRERMLAMKLVSMMRGLVTMDDAELWADYQQRNNKVDIEYALFDPASFGKAAPVTDAEAQALLKSDRAMVEAFFKQHERDYNSGKKVRARHILLKVGQNASAGEIADARSKAEKLIARIKGGESFEEIAKLNSDDPGSKDRGGDLDWFEPGQMVKEFEDAAFGLAKGAMTQSPVKSGFGFHIIRVEDIKAAVKVELKDVELQVAKAVIAAQKSEDAAKAAANKAAAELKAGARLSSLFPAEPTAPDAKKDESRVYLKSTGMFVKTGGYIQSIGMAPDLVDDAFAMSAAGNLPRNAYKAGSKYVVAVLKGREAPDRAGFQKDKGSFEMTALQPKQGTLLTEWVKAMREGAKVKINEDVVSYETTPERERNPDQY
ncbi:MAG: SurA N-terminal domain-containing protein [Myxococcota bacterium]|jgi:peptidyl-prolyl cis-trans isomerase D